ncbi:hypothetical protein C8R48DRAFT_674535 [Suillus tomentosus]|nr:hypothetical protein C8R48DRAFT_674535 [Suillus tomentosus]
MPSSTASTPPPIGAQDSVDIFLVRPSFDDESMYSNSMSALPSSAFLVAPPNSNASLPKDDEYVPSLVPSHPFKGEYEYNLPSKPTLRDLSLAQDDEDIPMLTLPDTAPAPTEGTFPYRGPSRPDGRKLLSPTVSVKTRLLLMIGTTIRSETEATLDILSSLELSNCPLEVHVLGGLGTNESENSRTTGHTLGT